MQRNLTALAVGLLLVATASARDTGTRRERRNRNSGDSAPPTALPEARAIDGTGNNAAHPGWGAAGTPLRRLARVAYADGSGAPAGDDRPSARLVSNVVAAQTGDRPNAAGATDMVWQWGQFLDHDIDLTPVGNSPEPFDIAVPAGDPWFDPSGTGSASIAMDRSYAETVDGVRAQFDDVTAFVDASNVYGSDAVRANALRTLDGTGRLKTGRRGLLPWNEAGLPNAPDASASYFLAGDVRANEQVGLTALHTLFVREHNHWARTIRRCARASARSDRRHAASSGARMRMSRADLGMTSRTRLSGDEVYELARAIVGAEVQAITYREFLPALLGADALEPWTGYRDDVDPTISNEFATASYRFGHSMLSSSLLRLQRSGRPVAAGPLPLREAFFAPDVLANGGGIEPFLRGLCAQTAQDVDALVVDDVRNFLFGPPGSGGFDLSALNIQRGRDHGLPSYTELRADLGLSVPTSIDEITSDPDTAARLDAAYGDVARIDAWAGGLAEDHVPGALVGETVRHVLTAQFRALRDGDRFWYQAALSPRTVQLIEQQTLARVIRRNTRVRRELPDDVWHVAD